MFKQIATLLRGKAHAAGAGIAQRNALVLLDQQIRDAGSAIRAAQRALATAMAAEQQEGQQLSAIASRLGGLEERARAALMQSCITLAKTQRDAAENARLVNRVETARTEKMLIGG